MSTRATRLVSDRAVNMSITGLVLLFLPSVPLGAQITGAFERLHRIEGLSPISMGWSVAGAGDVNRDGFDDVIVGARGASRVYSGADGSMLWELTGGDSVAGVGDVNKDGFDDVMTGNGPFNLDRRTSAFVYSGLDGTVLWEFRGRDNTDHSQSVSGAGDVNGDGFQDMIIGTRTRRVVGEERIDYAGAAYVYSGQDGTLLWEFLGQAQADQLGYSVAGAGDIDQDGFDDVLVGIPYDDPGGLNEAGSAIVYSGKDGTVLRSFNGDFNDTLGFSVAGAGDVNKDGVPDVIVGAPGANTFNRPGFAIVYSGQDGTALWQFDGSENGDQWGWSVDGAGDVNQDGFDDVIVGSWSAGNGAASIYSGKDGIELWQIQSDLSLGEIWLGYSVAGAGDVNKDGFPDVIVGAPFGTIPFPASASVYVYEPALLRYGVGLEGTGNIAPRIGTGGEIPQVGVVRAILAGLFGSMPRKAAGREPSTPVTLVPGRRAGARRSSC